MPGAEISTAVVPARRRRSLLLTWLYFRYLLSEFRWSLLLLSAAVVVGAILFSISPIDSANTRLGVGLSLYAAWMALLAQQTFPPMRWYIELINAFYPLLGFILIGEGVVRLALLMVSKRHGEKEWMKVMASTYRDHVILCGLGHLGIRILQQLLQQQLDVVVLEKEETGRFVPAAKALGVPVLIRDMKEDQSLLDAGIEHARSVIICTNDDMANLEVALDSRRMNPKVRIIMRLFDQEIAQKISGALTVDAVFSASALAAPMVAAMSLGSKVLASMSVGGVSYAAAEMAVDQRRDLIGRRVKDIEELLSVRVLALLRNGQSVVPPFMASELKSGDKLILWTPTKSLATM